MLLGGFQPAAAQQAAVATERPRVGLVLSGGVARGLAHIGVIRTLEEMGVPIDVVTGTSMGALVGGLYAAGYGPEALQTLASDLAWPALFTDRVERRLLSAGNRLLDSRTVFTYPVRGQRIGLPIGAVRGESIMRLLQRLTWRVQNEPDFARLPIPFAAVATDLETGEAVVFASGNLAEAMRASISMPGIFEPVQVNGRLLIDGGFARNLPAQDAVSLGAEVLICSDVSSQLEPEEELHTMVDVVMQTVTLHLRSRSEAQRRMCDVVITPEVSGLSGASFQEVDRWVERGHDATLAMDIALRRFARSTPARGAGSATPPLPDSIRVDRVEVNGVRGDRAERVARRALALAEGTLLGAVEVDEAVARLYGTNLFSRATYRVEASGADTVLRFDVTQEATDIVGFGLRFDDHRHASLLVTGTVRNWLSYGSAVRLDVRLGEQLQLRGAYLQAPGLLSAFGHEADAGFTRAIFDVYEEGRRVAELRADVLGAGIGGAVALSHATVGGARLGVERVDARPALPPVDAAERTTHVTLDALVLRNTMDHRGFPTRGALLRVRSGWSQGVFEGDGSFAQHLLDVERIFPVGSTTVLRARGVIGASIGSGAPTHRHFYLGGSYPSAVLGETQPPFWGLRPQERSGDAVQMFRLSLQKEVATGVFATGGVNAGNTFSEWEVRPEDYLVGWGASLGASSPLGPVEVTVHGRSLGERPRLDVNIGLVF
jgi:NTE family protein